MTEKQTNDKELPKCRSIMYTQQVDRLLLPDWKEEVARIVRSTQPKQWAGILHDKDLTEDGDPVAPHLHLMLYFEHARSPHSVAWEINAKQGKRKDAQVERLEFFRRPNNGYSYLVHRTANARDKYQYSPEEVLSNFDFPKKLEHISKAVERIQNKDESELIKDYLDLLYEGEITLETIEKELTGSQYAKASAKLKTVAEKRQSFLTQEFIDRMRSEQAVKTVIYLYGKAGLGKTKLARQYAQSLGKDYFITGSSRDPFQEYHNQEIVILDELRPNSFRYEDLLKVLDPYNFDVMIPSRYYDKALTARHLFITSPYSPKQLYDNIFREGSLDNFEQLERRLDCVILVEGESICETSFDNQQLAYLPLEETRTPNPFFNTDPPKPKLTFTDFITTLTEIEHTNEGQHNDNN